MKGYLGINSFPADQSTSNQVEWLLNFITQNCVISRTTTVQSATAGTPVTLVPKEQVPPGFRVDVVNHRTMVNGSTAYPPGVLVTVATDSGSPVFSIAGSALTADALVFPGDAGVTNSDEFAKGQGVPDKGEGLQVSAAADTTGSDLEVTVYYRFTR